MSDAALRQPGWRAPGIRLAAVQRGVLGLLVFSGFFALIEPSPYELMFVLAAFVFLVTGVRVSRVVVPLLVLLLIYNIGGVFSLIPFMDEADSVRFTAVSVYLMFTSLLFAAVMADDAEARLATVERALIASAQVAALAGVLGYFDVGGLGSVFTLYGRASGTFKDPNVMGPYLVLPIILVVQGLLLGRRRLIPAAALVALPLLAVLLSFSRGAWGNLLGSGLLMMALTFATAPSARVRARVVTLALLGVAVLAAALAALVSIDAIGEVFRERASLEQSYDLGVQGRFGNQIRSIPMLLEMPNGMGPLRFRTYFPEDPHNVYINAFASYGWLGGFAYLALTAVTLMVGWRLVFRPARTQAYAVALWSVLFVHILQGMQIDTDHWRHFYLMLGLVWGLYAVTPARVPSTAQSGSLRTTT